MSMWLRILFITFLTSLALTFVVVKLSSEYSSDDNNNLPLLPPPHQPIVNITNFGAVRGRIVRAANRLPVQEFLNIPYAQPPVGKLRFRPPVALTSNSTTGKNGKLVVWDGVRDGTQVGAGCVQNSGPIMDWMFAQSLFTFVPRRVSEDCLSINVHVPYNNNSNDAVHPKNGIEKNTVRLPVVVWLHGGIFRMGANSVPLYNGSVLASELGVIVAVPNFRLGPLGSFSLDGADGISGNQGLLDQALALQWIHEHIADFGGDPEQVTIMGLSTGSACVHYHLLSNMTRNYFQRAVMQSGTALAFWGHQTPQHSRLEGRWFAETSGCAAKVTVNESKSSLLECLQNLNVHDVILTSTKLYFNKQHHALFNPTTDGVFLTKSPQQHVRDGDFYHANLMAGTSTNEIMPLLAVMYPLSLLYSLPDIVLSRDTFYDMFETFSTFIDDAPIEAVEFVYRNWSVPDDARHTKQSGAERWRMVNAIADDVFVHNGVADILDAYTKHNLTTLYRYVFEHYAKRNMYGLPLTSSVHGDDATYFMAHALDPKLRLEKCDVDLAKRILHGPFNNFIRTGNPNGEKTDDNPIWKPYAGEMDYYVINAGETYGQVKIGPPKWRAQFWREAVPYLKQLHAKAELNDAKSFCSTAKDESCDSENLTSIPNSSQRRKHRTPPGLLSSFTNFIVTSVKAKMFDWTIAALPYIPL